MDYPQGTKDLYEHLGTHGHGEGANEHSLNMSEIHGDNTHAPSVVGHTDPVIDKEQPLIVHHKDDSGKKIVTVKLSQMFSGTNPKQILKASWPYALIFLVALFFYLTLFTNFSVISWVKNAPKSVETKIVKADKPVYANLDVYERWIRSYFYEVNDPALLDPAADISGNGLSNYQKFVLGLNPKRTDTMGLGMTDTQALLQGINPLTGSALTENQKKLIADYVDLESVANKLALQTSQNTSRVAGVSTDESRNGIEINTNIPAQLEIPKLKISVPVIWTQDTKDFDADLANGVVHYPGTAMPNEAGTAYISGHSSNYSWVKGNYNKIFSTLDGLQQYDSFQITATDVNGKKIVFHYVVTDKNIFKADDQTQFQSRNKSVVALSTCWPIGTSSKRLVVFGELSQTDK